MLQRPSQTAPNAAHSGGGDCLSGDLDRDRQAEAAAEEAVWTCLQKGAKGDEHPGMMRGPLEEEGGSTGMVLGAMGGLLEPLVCGKPLELLVTGGSGGGGGGGRGGGGRGGGSRCNFRFCNFRFCKFRSHFRRHAATLPNIHATGSLNSNNHCGLLARARPQRRVVCCRCVYDANINLTLASAAAPNVGKCKP